MATITSAQAGNWSDTSTWVGGVVPTSVDDVRMNHTIQANVDISIQNFLTPTNNNAGYLNVSTSRTITCSGDISHSKYLFGQFGLIDISASAGSTVTINAATITAVQNSPNFGQAASCIRVTLNPTVNINANIIGGFGLAIGTIYGGWPLHLRGLGGIINVNGNLSTSAIAASTYSNCILSDNAVKTINITGNLTSNSISVVNSSVADTIVINGVIQSISSNAVTSTSTAGVIRIGGVITNFGNRIGIFSPNVQLLSTTPTQWLFQTENAVVDKTLYDVNTLPTIPTTNNVRSGVSYASGALTGTLVVPSANAVTAGVTYDNGTVGTAQNTAASFLTALAASSDPLAVRLKNVATVQTTGDQIAAAL